jgi:hypothetical protein
MHCPSDDHFTFTDINKNEIHGLDTMVGGPPIEEEGERLRRVSGARRRRQHRAPLPTGLYAPVLIHRYKLTSEITTGKFYECSKKITRWRARRLR